MPKKHGVCLNVGGCSKAKNRELQEAEISEFICAECGKPLKEKKGTKPGGGDPPKPNKKKIIAIAAAIAVIGAGTGIGLSLKNNQAEKPVSEPEVVTDTVFTDPQPADTTTEDPKPVTKPKIINPEFGKYDGPRNASGKAHGLGGSVNVTKTYSLDLKDGNHTVVQLNPGDVIANTKFIDGKLVQGQLKRTDGTQKYLSIGN